MHYLCGVMIRCRTTINHKHKNYQQSYIILCTYFVPATGWCERAFYGVLVGVFCDEMRDHTKTLYTDLSI